MNTVTLKSASSGRLCVTAKNVPDSELITCLIKFSKSAQRLAHPIILVNDKLVSVPDFIEGCRKVNGFSTYHGGMPVYG